jgi:hypothetical protein
MLSAFICGGNWNNGVNCGARAVNVNNYPWNVNTNIGSRLACDSVCKSMGYTMNRCNYFKEFCTVVNGLYTVYQIAVLVTQLSRGESMLAGLPAGNRHF